MSVPHRFFCEGQPLFFGATITLSGEEFVHAKTVLRVAEGSEITLLGNDGNEYAAIVTEVGKHALSAHITGVNKGERDAKSKIYLLCGALKGDKTELVVQKATELGVYEIGVFSSRYCSAYMNENKLDRLNKVAREAAKQCLRSAAPKVKYYGDFCDALSSAREYDNKLFFCEFVASSDVNIRDIKGNAALVVGSEGGFAEEEYGLAKREYGFAGVTLGKRILRAETAAVSACTLAAFCLGELG